MFSEWKCVSYRIFKQKKESLCCSFQLGKEREREREREGFENVCMFGFLKPC